MVKIKMNLSNFRNLKSYSLAEGKNYRIRKNTMKQLMKLKIVIALAL